jgi:hypothetical protein
MASDRSYFVETPVGKVSVTPNNSKVLYISLGENINSDKGFQITVNGVELSGSLRIQNEGGKWDLIRENYALIINKRYVNGKWVDPSDAQRRKVLATVIPAVAKWLEENPQVLLLADATDATQQIDRIDRQIAELKQKLDKLRDERDTLVQTRIDAEMDMTPETRQKFQGVS